MKLTPTPVSQYYVFIAWPGDPHDATARHNAFLKDLNLPPLP